MVTESGGGGGGVCVAAGLEEGADDGAGTAIAAVVFAVACVFALVRCDSFFTWV